jgi:hypothetical protein
MTTYGTEKRNALRFANRVRKMLNLPPVDHLYKGQPNEGAYCPITNTIYDDDLDRNDAYIRTERYNLYFRVGEMDRKTINLPPSVRSFVKAFDDCLIPELDNTRL